MRVWLTRLKPKVLLYERESHRQLRQRLLILLGVVLILNTVGTILIHEVEPPSTEKRPSVRAWGSATEWTTAQLVAAGSSRNAAGEFSHGLEVFLQVCAVTVVASLAGAFGAFFHRRGLERHPLQPDDHLAE
jgi:hypothetical protein